MFKIALCGVQNSKHIINERISVFLGTSAIGYTISEFIKIEEMVATGKYYDLYFLNKKLRESENLLFSYLNDDPDTSSKKIRFVTYIDEPISDTACDEVIDCIKRHIEYDSMYLAIEFLTDRGLRSIAVSKILFFEYINRRIRIKTQNNEYFCNDSLRNILTLVGSHGFLQPHKSFIVNLKHITGIKNYSLEINDGSIIPLSQKKSKEFRKQYNNFITTHKSKIKKRDKRG